MKLHQLLRMMKPKGTGKRPPAKLAARTGARRPARTAARAADEGYDDEPNVSLSGAFIVVLLLHIVAIGGIFAFTKARQQAPPKPRAPSAAVASATAAARPAPAAHAASKPEHAAKREAAGVATQEKTAAPVAAEAPAPATSGMKDSGKLYTVAKGDNPVSIAKKLKVSSADLVALNGIEDPRKIQIGQKLKIPAPRD